MDTIDQVDGRRRRRKHSDEFKAKVVAACRRPGVSIASVALANKLNANLLRTWVAMAERAEAPKPVRGATQVARLPSPTKLQSGAATFLPLRVEQTPSAPVAPDGAIKIEVSRGATTIKVEWPVTAAAECSAWLKDVLR